MQPIHELLNRIHWDEEFAKGDFELGFLDRVEEKIIRLPFRNIVFVQGDHYFFIIWMRMILNTMYRFTALKPSTKMVN